MKPRLAHPRLVHDRELAVSVGDGILIGRSFAFLSEKVLLHPALAWVTTLFGPTSRGPRIIPLELGRSTPIPGVTVQGPQLPALSLAAVTSDKSVYREGKDAVHLCALHVENRGRMGALSVKHHGELYARHEVGLDERGIAHVILRDLPVGEFEVRWDDALAATPACAFTVATYRLAPLVARLTNRTMRGRALDFTLALTAFGAPFEGNVSLELHDAGKRIARAHATATEGRASGSFELKGNGPHAIVVASAADPAKTATVPIIGSRASERSETPFSKLGTEWYGSLLPTKGASAVRGVFLREDPIVSTTPIRLAQAVGQRVRLTACGKLGPTCIVVHDPTFPTATKTAVDGRTLADTAYADAEKRFQSGDIEASRAGFLAARGKHATPHPNYAYYLVCCAARLGRRAEAISWLRQAIRDGWEDFAHLGTDDDLASLRGDPEYTSLAGQGRIVVMREALGEGESIELPAVGPLSLITIATFVRERAWEGWAAVVAPSSLELSIEAPARVEPGSVLHVSLRANRRQAAAYVIVKDARLPSADTPVARLAGEMKNYVAGANEKLANDYPSQTLDKHPGLFPPAPPSPSLPMLMASAMPAQGGGYGAPSPMAVPMAAPAPAGRASDASRRGPYREPAQRMSIQIAEDEPELLFAGVVTCEDGKAQVEVPLGHGVADYVVEAFALDGLDWTSAEARTSAVKDTFASVQLPAFVYPGDVAVAQLHFAAGTGRARVRVLRDGADVPLAFAGQPVGGEIAAGRGSVTFLAEAGDYEAIVDDGAGRVERVWGRVDVPGKIRRRVRTVRFLQSGEHVSRRDDPSIVGLRLLPGLAKPFSALVHATADYGHACCEQTAAKLMSACAMFATARQDEAQRRKAESIIIAGVRRERSMFLEGKGFKMYPESDARADTYWGPMVARYLHYLAPLRELVPSQALARAIEDGLNMAADAARAYSMAIPPKQPASPEDAYAMAYFGDRRAGEHALGATLERFRASNPTPTVPGAVGMRADLAYGAATLLRAGGPPHMPTALQMANAVVSALGDHGRLYSTVDSVAAVALMTELSRANVVGEDASVEVNGRAARSQELAATGAELETVRAIQGVVAVEVTRVVEEDWGALRGDVGMRVWLEKNGKPARALTALDVVDLRVQLTGGYKPGDIAWVCLPDALARIVGGGQVKRFSLDFSGGTDLTIPLAITGVTVDRAGKPGRQRFAVAVRNMFEEERGTSSGPLEIAVALGDGPSGPISRALAALKSMLG